MRVKKWVDETIAGSVFQWFGYIKRMGTNRNVKKVYEEEYVGILHLGRPRKKLV